MTKPSLALPDRVAGYIGKHGLIADGDCVLAAVSGGPDSVALLDVLARLRARLGIRQITVIHFDHRLRAEESDADRRFVEDLARRAGFGFHRGCADVRSVAARRKISIEMAARECRHSFFRNAARTLGASKIALGHTADDQAEEVLMRIVRGTGPAGLRGMLPLTPDGVARPLLFATREEILAHLEAHRLAFRIDSTNAAPFCQRNALRLEVFPLLRKAFHPAVVRTIARSAELALEEESWWDIRVREAWDSACGERSEARLVFRVESIRGLHPALLRRLLRRALGELRGNLSGIHAAHLEPLLAMISRDREGKRILFPGGVEALLRGADLILRRAEPDFSPFSEIAPLAISGPGAYRFGPFVFQVNLCDGPPPGKPAVPERAVLDSDRVRWPLSIRFWRPGDRFHPSGMRGSKKLQDYFTDAKIPREERHGIPILCDREKICWVAGRRVDDRTLPGPDTKAVVLVRFRLEAGARTREGGAGPAGEAPGGANDAG